jgi:DNA-binding transcriptional ArsR family regulator
MAGRTDAVFEAIADATRRLIVDELAERDGQSLFEICVRLVQRHGVGMSRQAVSKHLAILEEAGIVTTQWQGRTKLHRLDRAPLRKAHEAWLARYLSGKPGSAK